MYPDPAYENLIKNLFLHIIRRHRMERAFCNQLRMALTADGERKFYIKVTLLVFLVWLIVFEAVVGTQSNCPPTTSLHLLTNRSP